MDIRRSRGIPLLLLLAILISGPTAGHAAETPNWEQLGQERQQLEESAGDALRGERTVVAELFRLNRTQEEIRTGIAALDAQIGEVSRKEQALLQERDRLELTRRERQAQFGVRARYHAENGTFAPLAFIISATSLPDFLLRMDILTQVMQRDVRLIKEIRSLTAAVEQQERLVAAQRVELTALRDRQAGEARRLAAEIQRKEEILVGLREQRGAVEGRVAELERVWDTAARPVLEAFGRSLQSVALKVKDLSPDSIKFSLAPPGATVRVSETKLNEFIQREADLKGLSFRFVPGNANLEGRFSDVRVAIIGNFKVKDKAVIRYEPKEIHLQDFALPASVTAELLAAGRLDMDFSSLIGQWAVKEISAEQATLVVTAGLK